jgi:hypothetical protein
VVWRVNFIRGDTIKLTSLDNQVPSLQTQVNTKTRKSEGGLGWYNFAFIARALPLETAIKPKLIGMAATEASKLLCSCAQLDTFGTVSILPLRVQAAYLATHGGVVEICQGVRGVFHDTKDEVDGAVDVLKYKGIDDDWHACQGNSNGNEGFRELH